MDPKATLLACDQHISDGDLSSAVDRLDDYYQWRLGGGFEPHMDGIRGDRFATWCASRISNAILQATEETC